MDWPESKPLRVLVALGILVGIVVGLLQALRMNPAVGWVLVLLTVAVAVLAVWLWVPFVSKQRAGSLACGYVRERVKGDDVRVVPEEPTLEKQVWSVSGYYVRDGGRHLFSLKLSARCGNLIEWGGYWPQ